MHERRLHTASTSGRVQRIWYMFAVGPPRSLIVPLKAGSAAIVCTSARTERGLRLWMTRPSCIVMEQVQPPKQPPHDPSRPLRTGELVSLRLRMNAPDSYDL